MAKAVVTVEAGLLMWREIRNLIRECRFAGMDVDYIESPGWLSRRFTIKGEKAHIDRIALSIQRLCE